MSQQHEQQALKWRLRLIFLYYASYADKNNYKLLKSQNYKRFLIDSEAVMEQSGFAPFDIAFRKIHSSSIKLQQFLDLLPAIAQLVYRNKNRKDAFRLFITHHMEKLYNQILSHSEFGMDVMAIQNLVVQKQSLDILNSGAVQKAYHKYIESTSMHQKEPDQTFQQLHILLTDFEISPKLVYKAMAYVAFYHQIQLTNLKTWGIQNLQQLLVCFAELHWRRVQDQYASQERKLTRLLQHMEISIGFKKMVEKHRKENAMMISFFKKPLRIMTQLNDSFQKDRFSSYQRSQPTSTRNNMGKYSSTKRDKQIDIGPIVTLLDDQNDTVVQLRAIFERLCSHGQVGNTQTLKSIKIKRYFKSLNILAQLQQTWVDITITELCRTSHSGKMEFPHFLQLMQIVAAKLNIDEEGFYHYLINQFETQPVSNPNFPSKVTTARQVHEPRALNIFLQVKKPLQKIFNHFRVGRRGMSFQQLTHALYQFDIFPGFINKSTLYNCFQKRSKATTQVKKLVGDVSLDFVSFLEVLADVSLELGDNLSEEQRIIFVLERMQDSQGHKTLLGSEGNNIIGDLRSKYAHIYKQNLIRQSPKKPEGFEELLQDI